MAQLQWLPLLAACIRDSQAMPQARPVRRGAIRHTLCRSVLAMSSSLNENDSQQRIDSQQHHDEAYGRGDPPSDAC